MFGSSPSANTLDPDDGDLKVCVYDLFIVCVIVCVLLSMFIVCVIVCIYCL